MTTASTPQSAGKILYESTSEIGSALL